MAVAIIEVSKGKTYRPLQRNDSVVSAVRLAPESPELSEVFDNFFDRPENYYHFISPPRSLPSLRDYVAEPRHHVMVMRLVDDSLAACATLVDGVDNEVTRIDTHEIALGAVRSDLQRPTKESGINQNHAPSYLGHQMALWIIQYGVTHPTFRDQPHLHFNLAVTLKAIESHYLADPLKRLDGADRMLAIIEHLGCELWSDMPAVIVKKHMDGTETHHPSRRFGLSAEQYIQNLRDGMYDQYLREDIKRQFLSELTTHNR